MYKFRLKKISFKNYNWGKLGLELLVVFLGVTGGFILNNWREEQQQLKTEQNYIQGFIHDVSDNMEELKRLSEADSLWLEGASLKAKALRDQELPIDSADVLMKSIISIYKFEPHTGTYKDIINSGNLNLIRNLELRTQIVDYQQSVEGVEFVDSHFYQFFNDYITPFVFDEFDVLSGEFIDDGIYKSVKFKNIFAGYLAMVQQRRLAYTDLLIKSEAFKDELVNRGHTN